jgi:predicted nuclease of predicted toxin-antitoxin system
VRLFLDQDVYSVTAKFLRDAGHDVITASDIGRSRATDTELLGFAHQEGRIMVTRDRDFGELVFLKEMGAGVIYLRLPPAALEAGHKELETVLTAHSEDELRSAFVVVEPGRHRFRRLPG